MNKVLVGTPIVYIGLILLSGSVQNAGSILVMSIICTLGISLVFWVPLAWLVGMITLEIFSAIAQLTGWSIPAFLTREQATSSSPQTQPSLSLNHEQIALIKYVRQGISCGFSDEKITNRLRRQGWSEEEINRAYEIARNS